MVRYIDSIHEARFAEQHRCQVWLPGGFEKVWITDNNVASGWRPKHFAHWFLLKLWRIALRVVLALEVEENGQGLLGKKPLVRQFKASNGRPV
jgi:hypothetical protein